MKKYLITGALALVACATFTSCHSDDELSGSIIEQKVLAYEEVFKQEFGFNPNHNWGFSNSDRQTRTRALMGARTRGDAEPRANMWATLGYDVPLELTPGQIERVVYYFQHNKLQPGGSKDWTDFFVQQVYKGGTSPIGNKTTPNGYSPEEYQCANGEWITGGDQMDYLTANNGDHVGNFNYARYGAKDPNDPNGLAHNNVEDSPDVTYYTEGQGQDPNHHKDHINLMVGSKAENFGYGNSNANKTYYDKYVLVDGSDIDKWMEDNGHNDIGEAVSGRAFVGFDFEQMFKDSDVYEGSWTLNGETYPYVKNAPNKYCGDRKFFDDSTKPQTDAEKQTLVTQGYLPVSGNDKEWARVAQCADGYFTDWIVCIAPGHTTTNVDPTLIPIEQGTTYEELTYVKYRYQTNFGESGRILCEDLGTASASDIDFNDIVFDAYIYDIVPVKSTRVTRLIDGVEYEVQSWSNWEVDVEHAYLGYTLTDVYLLAGGGTIPVTVGGYKLKDAQGFDTSDKTIVNTIDDRDKENPIRYGNTFENKNVYKKPVALTGLTNIETLNDIKIIVQYGQQVYELKAYEGAVPNKICVPIMTKWPYERIEINKAYNFNDYVKTGTSREDMKVEYIGNNRRELTLTVKNEQGEDEEKIYYLIDDKYNEDLWLNPTDEQKKNLYHGEPDYYEGDTEDITAIQYGEALRSTEGEGSLSIIDSLPDSDEPVLRETKTYGGGYQGGNNPDPVLIRVRH